MRHFFYFILSFYCIFQFYFIISREERAVFFFELGGPSCSGSLHVLLHVQATCSACVGCGVLGTCRLHVVTPALTLTLAGNLPCYVFFRLYQKLYERLLKAKTLAADLQAAGQQVALDPKP